MISGRWAGPVLVLLVVALVPTTLHTYMDWRVNDGPAAATIPLQLGTFNGTPLDKEGQFGAAFATSDWIHRQYDGSDGSSLRLVVARSYDAPRLYHHPEKAIAYARLLDFSGVTTIEMGAPVPVYLLTSENRTAGAAYALMYRDTFMTNPLWFQLRNVGETLLGPRHPTTLFFTYDAKRDRKPLPESRKVQLLAAAVQSYLSQR